MSNQVTIAIPTNDGQLRAAEGDYRETRPYGGQAAGPVVGVLVGRSLVAVVATGFHVAPES